MAESAFRIAGFIDAMNQSPKLTRRFLTLPRIVNVNPRILLAAYQFINPSVRAFVSGSEFSAIFGLGSRRAEGNEACEPRLSEGTLLKPSIPCIRQESAMERGGKIG